MCVCVDKMRWAVMGRRGEAKRQVACLVGGGKVGVMWSL